jgi:hypothetical protein
MPHAVPQVCLTPPLPVGFSAASLVKSGHTRAASPIDQLGASVAAVTSLAGQVAAAWSEESALVLTAGVVSAAEEFFREIVVRAVLCCPLCRTHVAGIATTVGAALSGSDADVLHTSLEGTSFSSATNLKDASSTYLGFKWEKDSSLATAMQLYEVVCTLRHCAVHSGGLVNRRNAAMLGVPVHSRVAISSAGDLLSLAHIVLATARLYNAELFRHVVSRWIDQGVLRGSWAEDRTNMRELWAVFVSESDRPAAALGGPPIRKSAYAAWQSIRGAVIARSAALPV